MYISIHKIPDMRIELIKGNTRIKTTIKTLACFCVMVYHLHIKHGETDDTTHFSHTILVSNPYMCKWWGRSLFISSNLDVRLAATKV